MKWYKASEKLPATNGKYLCYYDNDDELKAKNFVIIEFGTCYGYYSDLVIGSVFSDQIKIQDPTWGNRCMRIFYEKEKIWWTEDLTFPNGQEVSNSYEIF